MVRIVLLLLIVLLVFYLLMQLRRMPTDKKKKISKTGLFLALLVVLLFLAATGRLNWLIAAAGALLPLIPKAFRMLVSLWPTLGPYFRRYQQNRQSSMRSHFIRLEIDVLSGELKGEVLQGKYQNRRLESMPLNELVDLLDTCTQQDAQGAALLAAYLDQAHAGWRQGQQHRAYAEAGSQQSSQDQMSLKHAREVLGVTDTAKKKEIIRAHKQLMQKFHPDRGGSVYLAQQINMAKDILLKALQQ